MALTQEFWQITLPLMTTGVMAMLGTMTTIIVTASGAGKRIDDLGKRMDDFRSDMNRQSNAVNTRLERIEQKLDPHESRISVWKSEPLRCAASFASAKLAQTGNLSQP